MRLNIAKGKEQEIEGYNNIQADSNIIENLQRVTNNSCTEILCLNSLENLSGEDGYKVIDLIVQKTRNLGTLHISGLDFYSLSNSFVSGSVTIKNVNDALSHINTVYDYKGIVTKLEENNFVIQTLMLKGQTYQIEAQRIKQDA
tara:strand:+ start:171 stop:602 length:432 start_codon:yes stop_codon:yes gene_type:complete